MRMPTQERPARPREPYLVTALPLRGWARPAPHKGSVPTRTTTTPSPYGATPPHPGAGRETHRKILPGVDGFSTTSRTSPTEKGGSMCREGGGKGSPGVITLMNPGPYRPLYLWGFLVGGSQTNRPLPRGGSSRPMVTRLVRYGPVRQKTTFFLEASKQACMLACLMCWRACKLVQMYNSSRNNEHENVSNRSKAKQAGSTQTDRLRGRASPRDGLLLFEFGA